MTAKLATTLRVNALARERSAIASILQFENIATQAQYRIPYTITERYIRPGASVLDWGCGNGHFSLFLESLGAHVTGYSFEPSPAVMRGSSNFTYVPGVDGDPRTLPFPDRSFDAVVGVGVLEHVYELGGDESASLSELSRVLKPGGVLLTYHFPNQSGWIEKLVHALRLKKHFHKRKYTADSIRRLWEPQGFEIVDIGLYNALPRAELRALPGAVRHSRAFAAFYDALDGLLGAVAPKLCTNYFVVARKRA